MRGSGIEKVKVYNPKSHGQGITNSRTKFRPLYIEEISG